jgi:hypothetical protein
MKTTRLINAALLLGFAASSFAQQPRKPDAEHSPGTVKTAQFSPDGKRIVTTAPGEPARVWDAKTGEVVGQVPPSADQVLAQAKAKATAEHKAIFVHFGASWCGWCRKLDAFLDSAEIKPLFGTYFVPVKLVVQENERNKALENPGADTLLKLWGGPSGLPYSVFLNAEGKPIINSKNNGQNIGFPAQPGEIDYFIEMVRAAAPTVSADALKSFREALNKTQAK